MKTRLAALLLPLALMACAPSDDSPAEPQETVTVTSDAEPTIVEEAPEPPPDPSPAADVPLPDGTSTEALFVDLLRTEFPTMFLGVPDSDVVDLGGQVCEMFDLDLTFYDVVDMSTSSGYGYDQAGGLIGASVAAFCPEHSDVLP